MQTKRCLLIALEKTNISIGCEYFDIVNNPNNYSQTSELGFKKKRNILNKRNKILKKTNGKCYICGRELNLKTLTVDHFIPKSKHGGDKIDNLMPSCFKCNKNKGNKIPI